MLLRINHGIAPDARRRNDDLVAKRQAETITPAELEELIGITDQIEQHDARRLLTLDELARLRRTTLPELMTSLGIAPPADA